MKYVIYSSGKMQFLEAFATVSQPAWTALIEKALFFDELWYCTMWCDILSNDCEILVSDGASVWSSL